jgi:hypothetical protein
MFSRYNYLPLYNSNGNREISFTVGVAEDDNAYNNYDKDET